MILADPSLALEALSAWSTLGTGVIAAGAFGVAWFYGRGQVKAANAARKDARDLDRARSQPYVVASMESSVASDTIVDLVIKNYGQTAATNIELVLDPWPQRSGIQDEYKELGFPAPLAILAPDQEWRTFWDTSVERRKTDLPDRHVGALTYTGVEGDKLSSPVILDWSTYKPRLYTDLKTIHHVGKSMDEMSKTMKKFLDSPGGGMSVVYRDGDAKDERRKQEKEAYFASRATQASGVEPGGHEQAEQRSQGWLRQIPSKGLRLIASILERKS